MITAHPRTDSPQYDPLADDLSPTSPAAIDKSPLENPDEAHLFDSGSLSWRCLVVALLRCGRFWVWSDFFLGGGGGGGCCCLCAVFGGGGGARVGCDMFRRVLCFGWWCFLVAVLCGG